MTLPSEKGKKALFSEDSRVAKRSLNGFSEGGVRFPITIQSVPQGTVTGEMERHSALFYGYFRLTCQSMQPYGTFFSRRM